MARVQKTHSARRDLAHIWAYIAYDSPRNADLFLEKIAQTLARLADLPGIGTRREELSAGLRSIIFSRVVHGARDLPSQF
jgi:plasmid stabilization system protein ParE